MAVEKFVEYTVTGKQADTSLLAGGPRVVPILLVEGIIPAIATGAVFGGLHPDGKKA